MLRSLLALGIININPNEIEFGENCLIYSFGNVKVFDYRKNVLENNTIKFNKEFGNLSLVRYVKNVDDAYFEILERNEKEEIKLESRDLYDFRSETYKISSGETKEITSYFSNEYVISSISNQNNEVCIHKVSLIGCNNKTDFVHL